MSSTPMGPSTAAFFSSPHKAPPSVQPLPENQEQTRRARKGHKKSRGGCYSCKRRKIKCPEIRPACHNCRKIQVECVYPPEATSLVVPTTQSSVPSLREILHLQSTPTTFNLTDLRLFHHFLFTAYPHLPLGNEKVWVTDIASFSHSYDFLVHSVLGLAASHLTITSTSNLESVALSHRILAIRGLNEALSKPPRTSADGDAMLAACYALAMQSSYIGNSAAEFFTMLRGCNLVMALRWPEKFGTAFQSLGLDCQLEVASARMRCLPTIESRLVNPARASLEQLKPLCENGVERKVLQHLLSVIYALEVSSREAYFKYSSLCNSLSSLPSDDFQQLIDPTNPLMQILLAHFVAILVLIYPIKAMEWNGRDMGRFNRNTVFRLDNIYHNVPPGLRKYLKWPMGTIGSTSSL